MTTNEDRMKASVLTHEGPFSTELLSATTARLQELRV